MKIEFHRKEKFDFLRDEFQRQFPGFFLPVPEHVPAQPDRLTTTVWIWRLELPKLPRSQQCFVNGFLKGIQSTDV